jgi:hypothetical protein
VVHGPNIWGPGDLDVELSDPYKGHSIRLQFAAFVPAVDVTEPTATFAAPEATDGDDAEPKRTQSRAPSYTAPVFNAALALPMLHSGRLLFTLLCRLRRCSVFMLFSCALFVQLSLNLLDSPFIRLAPVHWMSRSARAVILCSLRRYRSYGEHRRSPLRLFHIPVLQPSAERDRRRAPS